MKTVVMLSLRALAIGALAVGLGSVAMAQQPNYQDPPKQEQDKNEKLSDGEREAINKVNTAADAATKLQAAGEFVKKYPKSTWRARVAGHVAGEIAKVTDPAQQASLGETFLTTFNEPAEAQLVAPMLIDSYVKAKRADDAFRAGGTYLQSNPEDIGALTQLAIFGVELVKQQNPKFVSQSQQYGMKAIELIEADKFPATYDEPRKADYKTKWLPALYQNMGIISFVTGNAADAKARLEKAAALNDADPVNWMLLGSLVDQEYQALAKQHQAASPGPLKDELLSQAHAKMDQVIELFAHAVAAAGDNPVYGPLRTQLMQNLEQYYKYRHKGSTDGLQALIDKHKKGGQ